MRFISILSLLTFLGCQRNTGPQLAAVDPAEREAILAVYDRFVRGGDEQNTAILEEVLHPTYRISINRFQGDPGVTILDRETYLSLVGAKKFGGDPRTYRVNTLEVVGNIAFLRTTMESSSLQFAGMYTFAKDPNGKWWLTADTPYVSAK